MSMLHWVPNLLTGLRLLLVPPVAALILQQSYGAALLLFAVAGASDALDGFLARRFACTSRLGALLDPLADKLLLIVSYVCLSLVAILPWWLTLVVLLRDLVIVSGAVAYRLLVEPPEIRPTLLGKLSTLLQVVLIVELLLQESLLPAAAAWERALILLVLLASLASGAHYVRVWSGKYRSAGTRHD